MCGITCIVGKSLNARIIAEKMTEVIAHRGPDGHGIYEDDGVVLGHRRLAVVDLSPAGHQPMTYLDRYVITYNGEIYNHVELREGLEREGYRFRSKTDTEVVLAAYHKWGVAAVHKLNGMWAFAIYDRQAGTMFCSRDRFGIKPLYYWAAPDGSVCFGSEIKQFTAHPLWRARVNAQRAYDFLTWGMSNHLDETLFQGVYQVEAGCSLRFHVKEPPTDRDGRMPVTQWYQLRPEAFGGSFDDATSEFGRRFVDSVRLHLRADVPVGSCLSGGLDSSSMVCVMNGLIREQGSRAVQRTFSACSDVDRFDEKKWADLVIGSTGVSAHYVYPALKALFAELPRITWHQDEPFNATGIYAQWHVFRAAAAQGTKVMLDGQGADEYLAGYHSFLPTNNAGLLRSGSFMRLWHELSATQRLHGYSKLSSLMSVANVLLSRRLKGCLRALAGDALATPDWLNFNVLLAAPENPFEKLALHAGGDLKAMSLTQLTKTHLPTLLHWEDRSSMAHSIESRVPFLDHRLVEFALGLPDEYKIRNGMTKRLLRSVMTGILPDAVRTRVDKQGFMTPEEVWMKQTAPDLFRGKLDDAIAASRGILNPNCRTLLEGIISGRESFSSRPWRLINFGEWMNTFQVAA